MNNTTHPVLEKVLNMRKTKPYITKSQEKYECLKAASGDNTYDFKIENEYDENGYITSSLFYTGYNNDEQYTSIFHIDINTVDKIYSLFASLKDKYDTNISRLINLNLYCTKLIDDILNDKIKDINVSFKKEVLLDSKYISPCIRYALFNIKPIYHDDTINNYFNFDILIQIDMNKLMSVRSLTNPLDYMSGLIMDQILNISDFYFYTETDVSVTEKLVDINVKTIRFNKELIKYINDYKKHIKDNTKDALKSIDKRFEDKMPIPNKDINKSQSEIMEEMIRAIYKKSKTVCIEISNKTFLENIHVLQKLKLYGFRKGKYFDSIILLFKEAEIHNHMKELGNIEILDMFDEEEDSL